MNEDVIKRLASFGYEVTEADAWVLKFIIDKTENHIKTLLKFLKGYIKLQWIWLVVTSCMKRKRLILIV